MTTKNDCPKCGCENSLVFSTHMKWGIKSKWEHFQQCQACTYESKVN